MLKKLFLSTLVSVSLMAGFSFADDPCTMPGELSQDVAGVYKIGTCGDLYKFAEIVNESTEEGTIKAELTKDICLNACGEGESVIKADGSLNGDGTGFTQWIPMDVADGVQVEFDGAGFKIRGMYIDSVATDAAVGLFGMVNGGVFISNLGIEDSYLHLEATGFAYMGSLVAVANGPVSIVNSYNEGTINGEGLTYNIGGLVGTVNSTIDGGYSLAVYNSYNAGRLNGLSKSNSVQSSYIGGIVGSAYVFFNAANVFNVGTVEAFGNNYVDGPIVGYFIHGSNFNCFFVGTGEIDFAVGKPLEQFKNGIVASLLYNSSDKVNIFSLGGSDTYELDGTIWRQGPDYPNFSGDIPEVKINKLALMVWDDEALEFPYPVSYVDGESFVLPLPPVRGNLIFGGWSTKPVSESSKDMVTSIRSTDKGDKVFYAQWISASEDGCYEIASAQAFYGFADCVNSTSAGNICGRLTKDICLNACGEGESVIKADGSLNGDGTGFTQWTPMNAGSSRTVVLDGAGHTIGGLYYRSESEDDYSPMGLFGSVDGDVSIRNLGIVDSYFKGGYYVGGLVGFADGEMTITNSYNAGSVSGSYDVGGLVGYAYGENVTLSITNSYNAGSVSGTDLVGGLVGYSESTLSITHSYNAGSVNGTGSFVGGLVGYVYGENVTLSITNSYNAGSVSGTDLVGGLVGVSERSRRPSGLRKTM